MAQCRAIKRDGSRCRGSVKPGEEWCWNHDPTNAERRQRNTSKAGKSKPSRDLGAIRSQLQDLTDRVLTGEVHRSAAAVCGQLLNVKLRAVEVERKIREQEELEGRIEALEQASEGGRDGRRAG